MHVLIEIVVEVGVAVLERAGKMLGSLIIGCIRDTHTVDPSSVVETHNPQSSDCTEEIYSTEGDTESMSSDSDSAFSVETNYSGHCNDCYEGYCE